jgi:hypothetical protein
VIKKISVVLFISTVQVFAQTYGMFANITPSNCHVGPHQIYDGSVSCSMSGRCLDGAVASAWISATAIANKCYPYADLEAKSWYVGGFTQTINAEASSQYGGWSAFTRGWRDCDGNGGNSGPFSIPCGSGL